MIINGQNFYEILEINEDASFQEVERAYLDAKETYSPKSSALYSMFSKEEALELHRLIEEAYSTLSNQDLRQAYDNENLNLSFSPDEAVFQQLTNEEIIQQKPLTSALKLKNGVITASYKEDDFLEQKIKELSDCSGSFIQKVRTYKNISLDDLSKFSKISKANILAIEKEEFESLPAKVFIRGFVMQVCKLLGLESAAFTKEYMKLVDEKRN